MSTNKSSYAEIDAVLGIATPVRAPKQRRERVLRADVPTVADYFSGTPEVPAAHLDDKHGVTDKQLVNEVARLRKTRLAVPAESPSESVGTSAYAVSLAIHELVQANEPTFLIPSASDSVRVGRPTYPYSPAPSPYLWVPVITQHTKPKSVVWEVGPAWMPSAKVVADQLGRDLVLIQPAGPQGELTMRANEGLPYTQNVNDCEHPVRNVAEQPQLARHSGRPLQVIEAGRLHYSLDLLQPELVLVPLPPLMDSWSYSQCVTAVREMVRHPQEFNGAACWLWPLTAKTSSAQQLASEQVEFAPTVDQYRQGVIIRLRALEGVVAGGSRICVSVPTVGGLPSEVELLIKRQFRSWKLLEKLWAFEDGQHRRNSNGEAVCGFALTVWGRA